MCILRSDLATCCCKPFLIFNTCVGTDPATDLRGGGCLGLLNLIYLTNSSKYTQLSRAIYNLSRHGVQVSQGLIINLCLNQERYSTARKLNWS